MPPCSRCLPSACVREPDRPWGAALLKVRRARQKTRARGARERHHCAQLLLTEDRNERKGNFLLKCCGNFLGQTSAEVTAQQRGTLVSHSTAVYCFTGMLFVKSFFCVSVNPGYINNLCGKGREAQSDLAVSLGLGLL